MDTNKFRVLNTLLKKNASITLHYVANDFVADLIVDKEVVASVTDRNSPEKALDALKWESILQGLSEITNS